MELWQALLVAIGGNAALLLVIAFLGRSLANNLFTKDLEKFKADLEVAAIEHQIRFSKLHEKRADVLAELYKLLVLATSETRSFVSLIEWAGEPDKKQKYQNAMNAIYDFFRFFDQHRIYIPEALCASVDDFVQKLRKPTIEFGVFVTYEHLSLRNEEARFKAWTTAWESVENDVPQLRSALEAEFRNLLGATTVRTS